MAPRHRREGFVVAAGSGQRETSRISVPADREQATIVRQFVRLACHRYGCDEATDNVLQVTDELVANAVSHGSVQAGATVEVGIMALQRGVRVEVHDRMHVQLPPEDQDPPVETSQPESPQAEAEDNRGLQIVASLADAWGVDDEADGKVVWAELASAGVDGRHA
jgi:anti-sigma regulatory factor (Ser/Thr protein kinase)